MRVIEHVEVDPGVLEETRHVCHGSSLPSQSSLVSSRRLSTFRGVFRALSSKPDRVLSGHLSGRSTTSAVIGISAADVLPRAPIAGTIAVSEPGQQKAPSSGAFLMMEKKEREREREKRRELSESSNPRPSAWQVRAMFAAVRACSL